MNTTLFPYETWSLLFPFVMNFYYKETKIMEKAVAGQWQDALSLFRSVTLMGSRTTGWGTFYRSYDTDSLLFHECKYCQRLLKFQFLPWFYWIFLRYFSEPKLQTVMIKYGGLIHQHIYWVFISHINHKTPRLEVR